MKKQIEKHVSDAELDAASSQKIESDQRRKSRLVHPQFEDRCADNSDAGENGQHGNSSFRVLALDGGGIHGAATAAYLACIERQLEKPIRCYFDLITGTSTGGLIGLALSRDVPAAEVETLYVARGPQLFKRRVAFPFFRNSLPLLAPLSTRVHLYMKQSRPF